MEGKDYEQRACCKSGESSPSDSCASNLFEAQSDIPMGLIIGIIVGIAACICACCICGLVVRSVSSNKKGISKVVIMNQGQNSANPGQNTVPIPIPVAASVPVPAAMPSIPNNIGHGTYGLNPSAPPINPGYKPTRY